MTEPPAATPIPPPPPAKPRPADPSPQRASGPGALAKLISLVISIGLAWALTVAAAAWLLRFFLARG